MLIGWNKDIRGRKKEDNIFIKWNTSLVVRERKTRSGLPWIRNIVCIDNIIMLFKVLLSPLKWVLYINRQAYLSK